MLAIGLTTILIVTVTFGFGYAKWIQDSPIDRTWMEVVLGVGFTLIMIMAAQGMLYLHYGAMPWWGILFVPAGFALTGLPMIFFQEKKFRKQKEQANDVKNRKNNG
jgi:hypothetical protein